MASRIVTRVLSRLFPRTEGGPVSRPKLVQQVNRLVPPGGVNLGGGPNFCEAGWLNLEEVRSEANPVSFTFTPTCTFPLGDASAHTVYTSHALEHLPPATVQRLLVEARRVLRDGGRLVIKIPDFDRVLECWKREEADFFSDNLWGFSSVSHTWAARGVEDCLDARAAMIFCGFWNDSYGDHFSGRIHNDRAAYHGPPVVPRPYLRTLLASGTPAAISADLSARVRAAEPGAHFNHQSAWSRSELRVLLEGLGLRVVSMSAELVIAGCADIPDIKVMASQSLYCLATKAPLTEGADAP